MTRNSENTQWEHFLKVCNERGNLGYSEDELERRAREVKAREDRKKLS